MEKRNMNANQGGSPRNQSEFNVPEPIAFDGAADVRDTRGAREARRGSRPTSQRPQRPVSDGGRRQQQRPRAGASANRRSVRPEATRPEASQRGVAESPENQAATGAQRSQRPQRPRKSARPAADRGSRPSAQSRQAERRPRAEQPNGEDARLQRSQRRGERPEPPRDEYSMGHIRPEHRPQVQRIRTWTTRCVGAVLTVGLVIGLLFFARPTASAVEKRDLTAFPTPTVESILDGSFFSGVSTWYADTYPLREQLVALDQWLEGLFGIQTNTMMVVNDTTADELPVATENQDTSTSSANAEVAAKKQVDPPTAEAMSEEIQDSIMNGLYIENGAAYSVYYFDQESVETYAGALNLAAERLDGTTNVYSILVPNNSGAMLSEETLAGLGGTDQAKALEYFYSLYSDKVTPIETLQTLRSHNSEYLYFRTDHHWTALGAYYVYRNLCSAIGQTPHELSDYENIRFSPFLGSFYTQLELDAMAANPDYVDAYYPIGTNDMTYWTDNTDDSSAVDYHVITDVTEWNENSKYATFIAGDKPLNEINNPDKTDGSSCVFVKDSYGCCFAPYLVDHYQTVYIIDFRYFDGNIVDFCQQHNVTDLIFLNNMTMATASSVGEMILGEVQAG